ncbi:hypothetical protein CVT25_010843, partial [Psilocybe cyanescens]
MSEPEIFRTSGTLFESDTNVLALTETLLPMNPLSQPGVRLMDRFADQLRDKISENIGTYYGGTDASVPLSGRYQAIAASILFSGGAERWCARHVADKVTAPDAELYAIRSAITWFTRKDGQSITFVYVPSRLQWDLHYKAHEYATELKVALGPRPATSFDSLRMQAALNRGASWNVMFQDPEYRGRNFLHLKMVDGAVAQPGGKDNPW